MDESRRERLDNEVERQIHALKTLIKLANVSVRELERRLKVGAGTLNRIFSGRIELKVRHVLMILDEIGYDPKDYYNLLYGERRPQERLADWIFDLLGDRPKVRPVPQPSAPMPEEEIERWMREMFDRLAQERLAPAAAAPPARRGRKAKDKTKEK
jgi:transcriptional regulator with XRE-family HTH domain